MTTPIDPAMHGALRCADVTRLRDAYLAGTLDSRSARAVELHAAGCAECGDVLEALTRVGIADFAPVPTPDVRERTLAAVRRRRAARRAPWWGGALAAAAAAALFVAGPWRDGAGDVAGPPPVTVAQAAPDSAPSPATIAAARSASEFEALDAAARELQQAIDAAPGDDELRDFLAAVRARRAELAQRVKDAAS